MVDRFRSTFDQGNTAEGVRNLCTLDSPSSQGVLNPAGHPRQAPVLLTSHALQRFRTGIATSLYRVPELIALASQQTIRMVTASSSDNLWLSLLRASKLIGVAESTNSTAQAIRTQRAQPPPGAIPCPFACAFCSSTGCNHQCVASFPALGARGKIGQLE